MAENQGTKQQPGIWTKDEEMNMQENSSATDNISENETPGESSWRPGEGESEMKEPTKHPTGAAGQSPAEEIETDNPGQNP